MTKMTKLANVRVLKSPQKTYSINYLNTVTTLLVTTALGFIGYIAYKLSKLDFDIPKIGW
ncbi:MAG: hypothetical protein ACXAC2_02130 [Candidatus Kariarchaeaceae archaeon]